MMKLQPYKTTNGLILQRGMIYMQESAWKALMALASAANTTTNQQLESLVLSAIPPAATPLLPHHSQR